MHDVNPTLAALRETLLPKLISGELRIEGVERIVGRAVEPSVPPDGLAHSIRVYSEVASPSQTGSSNKGETA